MNEPKDIELFVAMNEDGDWVVNADDADVLNQLGEECGGCLARVVKIAIRMTPPVMQTASVIIPDEAGEQHVTSE